MDIPQYRDSIVTPVLNALGMGGRNAEDLVIGTALVETGFRYIKQIRGPALGFYQCEPATYRDICRYIESRPGLHEKVMWMVVGNRLPDPEQLIWNLKFATAICRIHYWRKPGAIPSTIEGQGQYWKTHYNTHLGAGTVEKYVRAAQKLEA